MRTSTGRLSRQCTTRDTGLTPRGSALHRAGVPCQKGKRVKRDQATADMHYTSKETLVGVMRDQYKTSDGFHLPDHLAVLARAYKRTHVAHTYVRREARGVERAGVSSGVFRMFRYLSREHRPIFGSGQRCAVS